MVAGLYCATKVLISLIFAALIGKMSIYTGLTDVMATLIIGKMSTYAGLTS